MAGQLPGAVCRFLDALEIDSGTVCLGRSPKPGSVGESATKSAKQRIVAACEAHWKAFKGDCSGFAKAVAQDVGITLTGQANDIVDQIGRRPWTVLASGKEAKAKADLGYFVIGGLKADDNGHVVVVVSGPLNRDKYPTAYWGRLGGVGRKATTTNWSWDETDRDDVIYACHPVAKG